MIHVIARSLELDKLDFDVKLGPNKLLHESNEIYFRRHVQGLPLIQINLLILIYM